jgi:hypothetical protein
LQATVVLNAAPEVASAAPSLPCWSWPSTTSPNRARNHERVELRSQEWSLETAKAVQLHAVGLRGLQARRVRKCTTRQWMGGARGGIQGKYDLKPQVLS